MVPENIVWAFYSAADYAAGAVTVVDGVITQTSPKDRYYKDTTGKWVKVTAVFDCIATARETYKGGDVQYLGPVFADTKTEADRGSVFPPPIEKKVGQINPELAARLTKHKSTKSLDKQVLRFSDPVDWYIKGAGFYDNQGYPRR